MNSQVWFGHGGFHPMLCYTYRHVNIGLTGLMKRFRIFKSIFLLSWCVGGGGSVLILLTYLCLFRVLLAAWKPRTSYTLIVLHFHEFIDQAANRMPVPRMTRKNNPNLNLFGGNKRLILCHSSILLWCMLHFSARFVWKIRYTI